MEPLDDPERWIAWARACVVAAVTGKAPGVAPPKGASSCGVFVTIERRGAVVGCRGSLTPRFARLDREIAAAAESAAIHDPRYRPLRPADLADFAVTVTLVERLEPLEGVDGLRPEDGLVLTAGARTGVVLPWEGRDPQTRLAWAHRKAGVARGASVRLQRLVASRARG